MVAVSYILILIVSQGIGSVSTETVKFSDQQACLNALSQLTMGGGQATFATADRRILRLLDGSVRITGYCVPSATVATAAE